MEKYEKYSFFAFLECTSWHDPDAFRRVRITENAILPTDDGWLTLDESSSPMLFYFKYMDQTEDRIHYEIHSVRGGDWVNAQLDISRNGYLGMYTSDYQVGNWKVQPLNDWKKGAELNFILRSKEGRKVGVYGSHLALGTEVESIFRALPVE